MRQEWIAQLVFDPAIAAKIRQKHNVTEADVREAILLGGHERAAWDDDPLYGGRLVVVGRSYLGQRLIAYLRPVDRTDGVWECRTAMWLT